MNRNKTHSSDFKEGMIVEIIKSFSSEDIEKGDCFVLLGGSVFNDQGGACWLTRQVRTGKEHLLSQEFLKLAPQQVAQIESKSFHDYYKAITGES